MATNSTFRLLTFNCLWQGAARARLNAIAPVLNESDLDFLCLQEVTQKRNVSLLQRHLPSYGPAAFVPYGVAVKGGLVNFARRPIESGSYEVFRGKAPRWTLGLADRLLRKGFLISRLRLDAVGVVVVNTHMLANYDEDWTTGNRFVTEQRKDLAQLAEAVRRLDRESLVIVAGDFNVPMTNPLFVEFTSRCDLRSAFGPAPDAAPATIRQARPDRPALTIDNVLFRAPAGSSLQATARLRFEEPVMLTSGRQTVASDHLAVEAEFVF